MKNNLSIDKKVLDLAKEVENDISEELKSSDDLCLFNTEKVLNAFINIAAKLNVATTNKTILQ